MPTFQKTVLYFGLLIITSVTIGSYLLREISESFVDVKEIRTFEDCERSGGATSDVYPRNCHTIGGRIFIESPRSVGGGGEDDHLYPRTCVIRGCNNEYCMDEDEPLTDVSICEAKPERVCYEKAECSVQGDGRCGWVETNSFLDCLVQKKRLTKEPSSGVQIDRGCKEWFDGCAVCAVENVGSDGTCPGTHCSEKFAENASCRKF